MNEAVVNDPPKVTVAVVIPVFNGREHIGAALESARTQTSPLDEIIVVDDGSTDGSGEIAERVAIEDGRVRVLRQENRGLAAARNVGLRTARSAYVGFLDADDVWLPHKVETQLPLLGEARVVFSDAYLVDSAGVVGGRVFDVGGVPTAVGFDRLLAANLIPVLTAIVDRSHVLAAGGFDEQLRSAEDWDLWLRLASDVKTEFVAIDAPLARYLVNPFGLSSDRVSMARWRIAVIRKLARSSPESRRGVVQRRLRAEQQLLAGELRLRAVERVGKGDLAAARMDLREALRNAPRLAPAVGTAMLLGSDAALRRFAARSRRRSGEA